MRIAIFTDSFWPQINGVTTSILNMVRELSGKGHHFLIYAPKPLSGTKGFPKLKNTHIIWLPARPLPTYTDYLIAYSFSKENENAFWDFDADIVHVHTPFFVADHGIKLAKRKGIPVVGTFHTLISEFLEYVPVPNLKNNPVMKQLTWAYTQHFYGRCDVVTTPTHVLAKELESNGFKHVQTLSNGIDFDLWSKTPSSKVKGKVGLVYYGRISFEKRIDVAIETLALLRERGNYELNLIGSGPAESALKKQAQKLGVTSHVHFLGPKSGSALAKAVKKNHILLAPSPMETQGLYILESMAAGIPVVGCDMRAIPVALGKNQRGLLFPNEDAHAAAERVEKLVKNKALQKKLVSAAKKWVKAYSQKAIAKEWVRVYQDAIKYQS